MSLGLAGSRNGGAAIRGHGGVPNQATDCEACAAETAASARGEPVPVFASGAPLLFGLGWRRQRRLPPPRPMLARERKLTALHSLPRESHVRVGGRRRGPAARDRRLLTGASAQGHRPPAGRPASLILTGRGRTAGLADPSYGSRNFSRLPHRGV